MHNEHRPCPNQEDECSCIEVGGTVNKRTPKQQWISEPTRQERQNEQERGSGQGNYNSGMPKSAHSHPPQATEMEISDIIRQPVSRRWSTRFGRDSAYPERPEREPSQVGYLQGDIIPRPIVDTILHARMIWRLPADKNTGYGAAAAGRRVGRLQPNQAAGRRQGSDLRTDDGGTTGW